MLSERYSIIASSTDYWEAERWALKAIEAGYEDAKIILQDTRWYDHTQADSIEDAVRKDEADAESGDRYSMYIMRDRYRYGKGVKKDLEKAIEWFIRSGSPHACSALGEMYESG